MKSLVITEYEWKGISSLSKRTYKEITSCKINGKGTVQEIESSWFYGRCVIGNNLKNGRNGY